VAMESTDVLNVSVPGEKSKSRAVTENGAPPPADSISVPTDGLDMEAYVADMERAILISALEKSGGVQTRAAELLKISYRSFRHLAKKYNI